MIKLNFTFTTRIFRNKLITLVLFNIFNILFLFILLFNIIHDFFNIFFNTFPTHISIEISIPTIISDHILLFKIND